MPWVALHTASGNAVGKGRLCLIAQYQSMESRSVKVRGGLHFGVPVQSQGEFVTAGTVCTTAHESLEEPKTLPPIPKSILDFSVPRQCVW